MKSSGQDDRSTHTVNMVRRIGGAAVTDPASVIALA